MRPFSDVRIVIAVAAGALVLILLLVAMFLRGRHAPVQATDRPELQLQVGKADTKPAPKTQPVRCFVNGQLVGMTTLAECAQKNGTASQALDVGLDAAPGGPSAPPSATAASTSPTPSGPNVVAECLRYAADGWKGYGSSVTLSACVRVLFQGQCAHPGEAFYGRWGSQSLRLIPGRVEVSDDNKRFRSLVEQDADCSIPAM